MTLVEKGIQSISLGSTSIGKVYLGDTKVRAENKELCFTANTAGSTVQLTQTGSPTSVTLQTSTNGTTWSTYTIGNTITLSSAGSKVYFRNSSETDTGFSTGSSNYYKFSMTGSISASGDVMYLLNQNGATTASNYCFVDLFYGCTSLITAPEFSATTVNTYSCYGMFRGTGITSAPELPATTLGSYCYYNMFNGCTSLTTIPKLPATSLKSQCYYAMFRNCSKIKLSSTQTGTYQTEYRIPTTGTGTTATNALSYMFTSTGGTFTGSPSINTTYYTSNTLV